MKMPINGILICVVLVLYSANNWVFKKVTDGWVQYFFQCYFNDCICPLFFLSYSNILLLTTGRKWVSLKSILIVCIGCGLIWEFIGPILKEASTTDVWDIVCYVGGGLLYYGLTKHSREEKRE